MGSLLLPPVNVITKATPFPLRGACRYVQQPAIEFDDVCFDIEALRTRGLLDGLAKAGRGNTVFFTLHDNQLVLRHYHRGGLAQRVSKASYVFLGMQRTRAFREFDLLVHFQRTGLPAPRPYACRVLRKGVLYTASLVTHRLPGQTLSESMQKDGRIANNSAGNERYWRNIGEAIALFHSAGVYHADLNAHNIMLEEGGRVTLIDFDRSRLRVLPETPAQSGWCLKNLDRLERSISKVAATAPTASSVTENSADGFAICKQQWATSMAKLHE